MPVSSPIYRIIRVFEGSPTGRVNAMSNDLTVKKTSRRGFRAYVTKKVGEIDQLISDYNDRQATGGAGPSAKRL